MAKLSFILFALIGLCTLTFSVSAQAGDNSDVELILEEVEGGYIIVNWEDTMVYDEAPEEEPVVPVEEQEPEPAGNDKTETKSNSKSNKGSKKTSSKSKTTKKNLRGRKL